MTNYRGWLWSLAAVAGTATAAVIVYKYATRGARDHGESDAPAETEEGEDVDYEWLSEDEAEAAEADQQLMAANRGRNMLLAMFGLLLMVLVTAVSLVITWNSEDEEISVVELPMFQPLMWIAVGIFTAASMDLLTRSPRNSAEVPVLEDKAVFPHDAGDFEIIRQHDSKGAPTAPTVSAQSSPSTGNDDEEKDSVPGDIEAVIKRADDLFEQGQHARTREYLKEELPKYPPSVEMLWRLARACNYLVEEKTNPDEKKELAFEGLADAEKAYALNADSAASNKWMAIMTSTVGNFRDLKEKIAGAYVIRDHIQRAIELDPTDATSHNVLGQWCLAFADMTWIEKRAAAALFGTPPSATYEEAVQHFQAAEDISPGFWKKNVFLLAQTCMKMKRTKEAANWVLKAKAVPVKTKEDVEVARDIAVLMRQLKKL